MKSCWLCADTAASCVGQGPIRGRASAVRVWMRCTTGLPEPTGPLRRIFGLRVQRASRRSRRRFPRATTGGAGSLASWEKIYLHGNTEAASRMHQEKPAVRKSAGSRPGLPPPQPSAGCSSMEGKLHQPLHFPADGMGLCMAPGVFSQYWSKRSSIPSSHSHPRCQHPRSPTGVVDAIVPVAGQGESPLQARRAIGRIPALPGLGTGIAPGAPGTPAGTRAGMTGPVSGTYRFSYSRRCPRLDRCLRKHTPYLQRCTIAGHRLIGHLSLLHALEHLRLLGRRHTSRKQKKEIENLHHPDHPAPRREVQHWRK